MGCKKPDQPAKQSARPQRGKRPSGKMHPAGPHARPELTDYEATPGTGALPDITKGGDVDPGSE